MAEEVLQFLLGRCLILLKEEKEHPSRLSIRLTKLFRSIEELLDAERGNIMISSYQDFDIRDLLYDLIDSLSECRVFANQRKLAVKNVLFPFNCLTGPLFIRRMEIHLHEIEGKLKNADHEREASPQSPFSLDRQTYPINDASGIIGLDNEVEKINKSLIDSNNISRFVAIGIVGMAGVGKTALAQKIFCSSKVRETFERGIWVCLSETFRGNKKDITFKVVKYMLEEFHYDVDELTSDLDMDELLKILHGQLEGKRYLIVLDDVWHIDEWYTDLFRFPDGEKIRNRLLHGLPKGKGSGGAVIVTSRREHVAADMVGVRNLIRLEPRCYGKDDCWSIFKATVNKDETANLDGSILEKMRNEINDRCDGLPLAAKTLAKIIPKLN